ncbi:Zinc phosphodiesterase ELAC protein 2, partial [Stegodyphus mimosarum]
MILTTAHLPTLKDVKSLIRISNIYQVCVLSGGFYGNNIRSKNMPKVKPNTAALRAVRMKEKTSAQSKNFGPPSEIYLCVLGNGSISSPRALYMFTDHGRYLFNCGEGTQRLAHEYKMKLAKLDHIFITHRSWENLGGLLGLSLTIQDIGVPEITLHGPPGIDLLYDATEKFVLTRDLKIVKRNHNEKPYSDSCLEIQYIPIYKPSNNQKMLSSSSESDSSDGHKRLKKLKSTEVSSDSDLNEFESPSRKRKKLRLSRYKAYPDMTMAYVCKGHSKPGHLLIH